MLYAIAAVAALIIDQAVKYWTTAHVVLNTGQHKLIPGFIHLANVHNMGAAFSFMEGARWFFVALCVIFTAALIYMLSRDIIKGRAARWMAVMVMSGALGNCIDRVISGYVVDMFEFDFLIFGQQFPVFNVADIFITVCGIAFCVCILLEKPEDEKEKRARRAAAAGKNSAAGEGRTGAAKQRQSGDAQGRVTPFPGNAARQARPDAAEKKPDDPFAEWETYAASKKPGTSAAPLRGSGTRDIYDINVHLDEPMSHVRPVPKPEQPGAPPRPSVKPDTRHDETGFDLEDILAEFRDL